METGIHACVGDSVVGMADAIDAGEAAADVEGGACTEGRMGEQADRIRIQSKAVGKNGAIPD